MRVLRLLAFLLFLAALVMLGREAWAWHESGKWIFIPAGQLWSQIHRDSLLLLQPAIERHLNPALWSDVVFPLLLLPAWAVLGGLALILHLLARMTRRRRLFRSQGLRRRRD